MNMKRKPTAAQRELAAAEQALKDKWAKVPKFGRRLVAMNFKPIIAPLTTPVGRETPVYGSFSTPGGSCTKPNVALRYTGNKMIGIGTLHKSNAVPVFSTEEAGEIARMRRG